MRRKLLLGGLLLVLGVVTISFQSFFLASDSYPVNTQVSETLDIGMDERSGFGEVYFVSELRKDEETMTELKKESVKDTIGTQKVYTVDATSGSIVRTGDYFQQFLLDYRSLLVPKDYYEGLRDFDVDSEIKVEGKSETERSVDLSYEFKDFPQTDSSNVSDFMNNYDVDFQIDIVDQGDKSVQLDMQSDDVDEELSIQIDQDADGSFDYQYSYTDSSGNELEIETEKQPQDWNFEDDITDFMLEYGHIRRQPNGSFAVYDSLVNGTKVEELPPNTDNLDIPEPGEDFGGIQDYDMNLSTVDVQMESGQINEVISVKLNGQEIIGESDIEYIDNTTARITFGGNNSYTYSDDLSVEFEGYQPKKEMGYLVELDGYGSANSNMSTGVQTFDKEIAESTGSVVKVGDFTRTFEESGEYEFEVRFEGEEGKINSKTKEFQIYDPSAPPAIFDELTAFFQNFLGN